LKQSKIGNLKNVESSYFWNEKIIATTKTSNSQQKSNSEDRNGNIAENINEINHSDSPNELLIANVEINQQVK